MDKLSLAKFVAIEWLDDVAMTAPQAGRNFGTSRGNARYYLNKLVDEGILIRLQHENNVWYILSMHKKRFEKFNRIGVFID